MSERADLMTSQEACHYLRFTGKDRLNSLYRFIEQHGIRKHYRSRKRLLLDRADLDAAVMGRGGHRRRAAMQIVSSQEQVA
jgi:hypothetical protein